MNVEPTDCIEDVKAKKSKAKKVFHQINKVLSSLVDN